MVEVVKRNGSKETFDCTKKKRSIEKAAIDAGYNLEELRILQRK